MNNENIESMLRLIIEKLEKLEKRQAKYEKQIAAIHARTGLSLYYDEVKEVNKKAFGPHAGDLLGRDAVILATGPSLVKYKPIANAVHIGINSALNFDIPLDYYFAYDFNFKLFTNAQLLQRVEEMKRLKCVKFIGRYVYDEGGKQRQLPDKYLKECGGTPYYLSRRTVALFHRDISRHPVMSCGSVAFHAMHFALYAGAKRVYIVGCDGWLEGNNYFDGSRPEYNGEKAATNKQMINGWQDYKSFINRFYPDTEVFSINPGILRGIFTDIDTDAPAYCIV